MGCFHEKVLYLPPEGVDNVICLSGGNEHVWLESRGWWGEDAIVEWEQVGELSSGGGQVGGRELRI